MSTFRFVSPERRWRAGFAVLLAAWFGWRSFRYPGPPEYIGLVTGSVLVACLLGCAVLIMRTCLVVSDEGLVDKRAVRTVRVAWESVTEFRVARPGALWGGFCVVVGCRDGRHVDLLSTRAYSRTPSSRHLDELQRLCWTLEERLTEQGGGPGLWTKDSGKP